MSHALLLGATGLVGRCLLEQLLDDPQWESVTVLGRRELPIKHPKLRQQRCDFESLAATAAASDVRHHTSHPLVDSVEPETDGLLQLFTPIDAVFCCLGTTIGKAGSGQAFRRVDYDYCVAAATLANHAGVPHFLMVSAVNADANSRLLYPRTKGEAEQAIAGLGFAAVTFARPSLLIGERDDSRPGEQVGLLAMAMIRPLVGWSRANWLAIEADRVAAALKRAAANPDASGVTRLYYADFIKE